MSIKHEILVENISFLYFCVMGLPNTPKLGENAKLALEKSYRSGKIQPFIL